MASLRVVRMRYILSFFFLSLFALLLEAEKEELPENSVSGLSQTIEGRVIIDSTKSDKWLRKIKVSVDDGTNKYYGYLKANGDFEVHGVPPGSYLVEIISPNYIFEPVRIDISSKSGKIRARQVNVLKATSVQHLPYPLKFKAVKQAEFFEKREPWSIISTLKNPMVTMLLCMLCIMPYVEGVNFNMSIVFSKVQGMMLAMN